MCAYDFAVTSETAIANLLYRYADCWDRGDLAGAAALFTNARVRRVRSDGTKEYADAAELLADWTAIVRIYADGTPRTRHVVTNPVIQVDEDAGTATAQSYCTVFQSTDDIPLQPIAVATHVDAFQRSGGEWHFSARDYHGGVIVGDVNGHLVSK